MIKEALKYFLEQSKPDVIDIYGDTYSNKPYEKVVKKPYADEIHLTTLSSLVEYIKAGVDVMGGNMIIHVVSPTKVSVFSCLDENRKREHVVSVCACLPNITMNSYVEREKFNIALQSKFVANDDKDLLLRFVGTVEEGTVAAYGDDGVSQKATIKTSLTSKGEALVPNPVVLKPYRTFTEVDQPESAFVFRMKSDKYEGITCAIFEADGGAWQLDAMNNVKEYLKEALKDVEGYVIIS